MRPSLFFHHHQSSSEGGLTTPLVGSPPAGVAGGMGRDAEDYSTAST